MSDSAPFSIDLPVRISEVNYGDHLGHAALASLLHQTKIIYFKSNHIDERDIHGIGAIVKRLEIDYRGEAHFNDMLHIKVSVKQIGKTTCTLEYEVTKNEDEKNVSNAIETLAFINYETRRPVRTPPEIIALSSN